MASIHIIEVRTKRERKAFVTFPMKLYSECPYYVPSLIADELETLSPDRNPVFQHADARLFLALNGTEVVGRIAGIVNHVANEKCKTKELRFGWFDSVNDDRVAAALFDAVEAWGRELGMEKLIGPSGFCVFDKEGMLTDGFDTLPTMATYYNFPYYCELVAHYGFTTDADLVEYRIPDFDKQGFPPRLSALAERLKQRSRYRVLEFSTKKQMLDRADECMNLLQETYWDLHGYSPITEQQKPYYMKKFFPFLRKDLVKAVVNERDEMIGFLIAMPSISEALRKANGRLFPFGFLHLLYALRCRNDVLDVCLMGVKKQYRGQGVDLILASELCRSAISLGFRQGESNPELNSNHRIRAEWKHFDHILCRRRKIYTKPIAVNPR